MAERPDNQDGPEAELTADFARYLKAWTREEDTGEPEFDDITEFSALAAFFVSLVKRRLKVGGEAKDLNR